MFTIHKKFKGYPFAHRQHTHGGHCKLIHGHNWDFEVLLEAEELDENGFVYDFGKFKWLKKWLGKHFDHTLVLNADDPEIERFKALQDTGLADVRVVDSGCSSEGLAQLVYYKIKNHLEDEGTAKRVRLVGVKVVEDENNCAWYTGPTDQQYMEQRNRIEEAIKSEQ